MLWVAVTLLSLCCRTLDDMEMYEQQQVFSMKDYLKMSEFLNLFVFRVIWNSLIGESFSPPPPPLAHTLFHFTSPPSSLCLFISHFALT